MQRLCEASICALTVLPSICFIVAMAVRDDDDVTQRQLVQTIKTETMQVRDGPKIEIYKSL